MTRNRRAFWLSFLLSFLVFGALVFFAAMPLWESLFEETPADYSPIVPAGSEDTAQVTQRDGAGATLFCAATLGFSGERNYFFLLRYLPKTGAIYYTSVPENFSCAGGALGEVFAADGIAVAAKELSDKMQITFDRYSHLSYSSLVKILESISSIQFTTDETLELVEPLSGLKFQLLRGTHQLTPLTVISLLSGGGSDPLGYTALQDKLLGSLCAGALKSADNFCDAFSKYATGSLTALDYAKAALLCSEGALDGLSLRAIGPLYVDREDVASIAPEDKLPFVEFYSQN